MRHHPLLRGAVVTTLAATALVAVANSSAGAASPMSATVISVPLTIEPEGYADIEACIGESIAVTSGTYQLVLTDRDTQFLFHANAVNGRAIGVESGDEYRVIGHQQEVAVAKSTGAIIDVFELRLRVIGTAGATSFHAHIYFHLTIRPDGEIVVERGDWVTTC